MKKQITILTAIALFIAMTTNATVWRVNNRVNVDADFTTLQAAYNGASANDTIYLEGSATSYGNASLSKPLTIIGTGYFLNENDSTQAHIITSKIDYITFSNGSQGSVIEGVTILGTSYGVTINTDDITVRRNHIVVDLYDGSGIQISSSYNSILIEQNWIEPKIPSNSSYTNTGISFTTYPISTIIRNNIIIADTNDYAIKIVQENEATSLIITNNAIFGDMQTYYTSHYNNILIYGAYTPGLGDLASNNLCNATQYPNTNANQQNVVMSSVFTDYTSYIDNGYILKAGSPAIGAGVTGEDCGAFGTFDPYVLSGMPPIPAIFDVEMTQAIGTVTIPVTIKAMSHN